MHNVAAVMEGWPNGVAFMTAVTVVELLLIPWGRSYHTSWSGSPERNDRYTELRRRKSSIAAAARRPAPMAEMTVAPPVTMSPPAKTPSLEVSPEVCSSSTLLTQSDRTSS